MGTDKVRLGYLDAMRGLAIVLVVMGHLMIRFGISEYENVLWTIIVGIHLPIFFFVSGYLGGKLSDLSGLCGKAWQLILPGLLFYSLSSFSRGGNPLSFVKHGFDEYWFTFVLFEIYLIYYICGGVFKRYKYVVIMGLSLAGIALLTTPSLRGGRLYTVLCIENLAKYFQFFTLGMLCKEYSAKVVDWLQKDWVKGALLVGFVVSLFLCFSESLKGQYFLIYQLNHNLAFRYLGVFALFAFFIYKAELFQTNNRIGKSLTYVGKRTLDIYLIHYFLLPPRILFPECLQGNDMWYAQLLMLFASAIVIIAGCLLFSELIRMSPILSSFMLGTRKLKKNN